MPAPILPLTLTVLPTNEALSATFSCFCKSLPSGNSTAIHFARSVSPAAFASKICVLVVVEPPITEPALVVTEETPTTTPVTHFSVSPDFKKARSTE